VEDSVDFLHRLGEFKEYFDSQKSSDVVVPQPERLQFNPQVLPANVLTPAPSVRTIKVYKPPCLKCGYKENRADHNFCGKCGNPYADTPSVSNVASSSGSRPWEDVSAEQGHVVYDMQETFVEEQPEVTVATARSGESSDGTDAWADLY